MRAPASAFAALVLAALVLAGCGQALSAVLAPQSVAAGAAASAVEGLSSSINAATAREVSGGGQTVSDIDRILADVPEGSEQHNDLTSLRSRIAESGAIVRPRGPSQQFISDPKRGHEHDRRIAEAPPTTAQQLPGGGRLDAFGGNGAKGHRLILDPPRATGVDVAEQRDQPKPFHAARSSDLDQWEPRFYGTTMPRGALATGTRLE
ncbi:MAG TPA: hypothetical protein VEL07_10140 [Planctomycetota bacterium]|nr:hypothetical protein [Planctomycetota bacterium]